MKTIKRAMMMKRLYSLILACCLMIGTLIRPVSLLLPVGAASSDTAFSEWTTDGWTIKEEGEDTVLRNPGMSLERIYTKGTVNTAYLEYEVYIDAVNSDVDANIGALYTAPNSHQIFFEYNTVYKFARMRLFADGGDNHIAPAKSLELATGTWHRFTMVLEEDHLCWYINDQLVFELHDSYNEQLTGGTWCIQGYNTAIRIKNAQMYHSLSGAFAEWNTDGWDRAMEAGEPVLKSPVGEDSATITTKEVTTMNCLELDVLLRSVKDPAEATLEVILGFSESGQYVFAYSAVSKTYRLLCRTHEGESELGSAASTGLAMDQWHTLRILTSDNLLEWYVNDKPVLIVDRTRNDDLSSGAWTVQVNGIDTKLRGLTFSNAISGSESECTNCDFEFTSAASVEPFRAAGGSVGYADGALVYTLSQANSSLSSPIIGAKVGTAYSAKMNVKNTVLLRLRNDTDAKQIKVYFKTDLLPRYSEENSVTVEVTPHGGYQTVYANFSACPGAKAGYLKAFKLVPQGADSGAIYIDAVSFEREKAFYDYAGEILSCTSDGETVTVTGRLDSAYAGKTVKLYELKISNYTESVTGLTPIAEAVADGTSFTVTLPFMNGNVTRLTTLFMVTVDGVKISDRFMVENYRDFTDNPYAFTLPALTVDVTDARFGAKGDGFVNDTAAIQAAIDYVTAQGGGTVRLPGDDSYYGRRYVATNIKLKDNVELRIEEGATLLQSSRAEDYAYEVFLGHDVPIPGVNWTHAFLCRNYPLIQASEAKNIRVTGGGTVRMSDTGSENLDGVDSTTLWTGCESRIHIIPFGIYGCTNVEISDITILRSNGYHSALLACENAYVANLTGKEVTCASGDGIALGVGTHQVLIDRFVLFSNDDAITLWSTYDEPRGLTWWKSRPEQDNSIRNIKVKSGHIASGHGITFIPWGTDNPDLSKNEIRYIEVTDCILDGPTSVGTWADNPYFGGTFTNTATDDFSPVRDVYIHDNKYFAACTLECITGTNILTDCGITSHNQFVHGDFERHQEGAEQDWVAGLANWSYDLDKGATMAAVEVDGGHAGKLTGTGSLYQGLYLTSGLHRLSIDTNLVSGGGRLFARDRVTGELLASADIPAGNVTQVRLAFVLTRSATVCVGVELTETGEVYVDNASMKSQGLVSFDSYPDRFTENFETLTSPSFNYGSRYTIQQSADNNYASAAAAVGRTVQTLLSKKGTSFDMRFHFRISELASTVDGNVGLAYGYTDINNCYFLEFNPVERLIRLRRFKNGAQTFVIAPRSYDFQTNEWMQIGIRVDSGKVELYIDGELVASGNDTTAIGEGIAFSDYNVGYDIDNVVIAESGTLDMTETVPLAPAVKEYVLYFVVSEGDVAPTFRVLTEGRALAAVEPPVLDGYIFKGWAVNGDVIDLATFRMPASNVVMTAVWEKIPEETTASPEEPTREPESTEPSVDTDAPTSEPNINGDTDVTKPSKKGCRSVIPSLVLLLLLIPFAWIIGKPKKEI